MVKDKSETNKMIMLYAKKEFLEKGFEKASMRTIASNVGITAAGIYRHFKDKEAVFEVLVSPVIDEFNNMYKKDMQEIYTFLNKEELKKFWAISEEKIKASIKFMYAYFDEFKLLLTCSGGTKFENFKHDMVMMEVKETLVLIQEMKRRHLPVNDVQEDELHMLMSAYMASIFQVVIHEYSKEKALGYIDILVRFFYPGWSEILGF